MKKQLATLRRIAADNAARLSAGVLALGSAVAAHADGDPFTQAVTDATTKIGVYGAALVGVSAVGVIFMIGMKYVKRIPRAS